MPETRRGGTTDPRPVPERSELQHYDTPLRADGFRLFLQNELVRRCQINPRYSLRSFAGALDLEPSALSKILAGKRRLTLEMFHRMVQRLALGPEDIRRFLGFGGEGEAEPDAVKAAEYDQIRLDTFQVISDWYHLAIVELANTRSFRGEPHAIARTLDITAAEARVALERLLRLGLLAKNASGRIVGTSKTVTTVGSVNSAAALRKMQRQVLEKAIRALDEVPPERRDQSNMTMAVNVRNLESAKEMIRDFRRKLCAHLESGTSRTEVYHLSVSLYPVSNQGK